MGDAKQDMTDDTDKGQKAFPNKREVELSPKIQDAIGRSLIAHYNDIVGAAIPDKFLSLLAELEAKEQENGH